VVLPKPVATAQYWHRSLNPKKLISVGFSRLAVSFHTQFLSPSACVYDQRSASKPPERCLLLS